MKDKFISVIGSLQKSQDFITAKSIWTKLLECSCEAKMSKSTGVVVHLFRAKVWENIVDIFLKTEI